MAEGGDVWQEYDNSVYLSLASMLTADNKNASATQEDTTMADDASTSEDEPLAHYCDSDDEPLSTLLSRQHCDVIPRINIATGGKAKKRVGRKMDSDCPETVNLTQLKRASRQEEKERRDESHVHHARLNNLLSANGLRRLHMIADGNCFFEAASTHMEGITAHELRNCLCDFLEDNFPTFANFMQHNDEGDDNGTKERFLMNVHELRQSGKWTNDAADFLPLALADWTQRPIKIFTSNQQRPVFDVLPTSHVGINHQNAITLAFLQCYPEHYDACVSEKNKDHSGCSSMYSGNDVSQDNLTDGQSTNQQETVEQTSPPSPEKEQLITPRKQGAFTTPPTKKLVRKRTPKPETWKQSVRKTLRLEGKAYVSQNGKARPSKKLRSADCSKCRFSCQKISKERQEIIFNLFYSLGSYDRQKQFVCSNIVQRDTPTVLADKDSPLLSTKRRTVSRAFFFTIDGEKMRVCRRFFLATLAIGEGYVQHAMMNSQQGAFTGYDGRGKHTAHNKTTDRQLEHVKEHIQSFPCVESHYTRQDTQRHYLDASLNITKMYQLYEQKCKDDGMKSVSCRKYRDIFASNFNLSFHKPKKDQCLSCTKHTENQKRGTETEEEKSSYQEHINMKNKAREEKTRDKQLAKKDPATHVVTLDLQAVLPTPCGMVSQLYYTRKLSVYNFTIYSLGDGNASCFIWDETQGRRGSCEIATCIFLYLKSLPVTVTDVVLFSDCCGGQNRNQT